MRSLCMNNSKVVVGDLDRQNIFFEKIFRGSQEEEALEKILEPMILGLKQQLVKFPLTIIYLKLRFCGFAYKLFEYHLGSQQYYPTGAEPIPKNRLFAQYHSPQTELMKKEILEQLTSGESKVRIIFATVAIGMGVNVPNIRQVIHIGVPTSIREYYQEIGRCGRDGHPAKATLYYNNRDIAKNRPGISDSVRTFCKSEEKCLRKQLLEYLDAPRVQSRTPGHLCCSVCQVCCSCATTKMIYLYRHET